ncbi:sensor histidine kinase [Alicyclobacillus macrosporangiidus]|uniref:histidine kinase n=1 Tax=Alicyclobacillus macrosporangiidus TaxID=392015 RepID=A0A1I7L885_9BACL|nr:HAMP domain-containing sensor histidine kinase [Alicyclobacillus macrosporangiidus]SFV05931.1 Signal transduction histidine kinase [Alicyclobacillus macrosporangiidus]
MNLRRKILIAFFLTVSAMLVALAFILQAEVHRHFLSVVCPEINSVSPSLTQQIQIHFEQALTQSLLWTVLVFVAATAGVAVLVSRAITGRIFVMQKQALEIAHGKWGTTIPVEGHDELSSLASTLNFLSQQLQKQEELRKNLMQDLGHELRTPLTTLRSHIQAFYDGLWEPNRERLYSCLEEIQRFEALVTSVETLYEADIAPAASPPDLPLTDLNHVAQSAIQLFEPRCAEAGIRLELRTSDAPVRVAAQAQHVSQILWNLLDNAVKFTPHGGNIVVEVGSQDGKPFLSVKDSGVGIPETEIDNIFERFYRVDKSRDRKTGGSGLGLAIVKRLVELSGGSVQVKSRVGQGSTFTVMWPK